MVPVGGFLSHGEPLKFLVVWGCFQGHFIQVDEDSIGNWTFGFFLIVTHLTGCTSQPQIPSLNSKHVPIIWSTLPLEAFPHTLPSAHPQWCVSSNLRAPSRSRFYTEMAELYFDWDFRMVGDEFFF